VPQLASPSAKIHAHSQAQAPAARAAKAPAASAPFASLLDDTAPAAPPPQGRNPSANGRTADSPARAGSDRAKGPAGNANNAPAAAGTDSARAAPNGSPPESPLDTVAGTAAATVAATTTDRTTAIQETVADADQTDKDATESADQEATAVAAPAMLPEVPVPAASPAPPAAGAAADADATAAAAEPAPAGAAVATAKGAPQQAPAEPAFVAAAVAQKLDAFDAKAKTDGKSGAKAELKFVPAKPADAATAAAPLANDDDTAPPTQASPAPDAKPAVADKAERPKPDASAHHARFDATAAGGNTGSVAPAGTDAGAQSNPSASAAAAATAHASGTASGTTAPTAPTPMPPPAVPIAGLAVAIATRAQADKNNFEIRLDPPELGRIQVKLTVDHQGHVTSHLIADRPDTLDLLRRDASGLERALQDAGLKTAGDGLQFSLRDQSFTGQQQGRDGQPNATQVVAQDDTLPIIDAAAGYTRYAGRLGGVDIRV